MFGLLNGACILLLAAVMLQDFKERALYRWYFPLLFVLFAAYALLHLSFVDWLLQSSIVIGFLLVQALFLLLWFRIRKGSWNILDRYLGTGDVFFCLCAALLFDLPQFLFFYLVGLLLALFFYLLHRFFTPRNPEWSIPLAGIQALVLLSFFVLEAFGIPLFRGENRIFSLY